MTILLILVLVLGLLGTAVLFYAASYYRKRARILEKVPAAPVAELEDGAAKVVGTVVALKDTLKSPVTGAECVYYRLHIEKQRSDESETTTRYGRRRGDGDEGDDPDWETVIEDEQTVPFGVEDDTGVAAVDARDGEVLIRSRKRVESGFLKDVSDEEERALTKRYASSGKTLSFTKRMRYTEVVIEEGDEVQVIGEAEIPDSGKPRLRDGSTPLQITDETDNPQVEQNQKRAKLHSIAGASTGLATLAGATVLIIMIVQAPSKPVARATTPETGKRPPVVNPVPKGNNPPPKKENNPPLTRRENPPPATQRESSFPPPPPPPPPPMPGGGLDDLLAGIQNPDLFRRREALQKLAATPVDAGRKAEVSNALSGLLRDMDRSTREYAARCLGTWAAPAGVTALADAMKAEKDVFLQRVMVESLEKLKDPAAAEALASLLGTPSGRPAEKALRAIGPAAEKAVQPYLDASKPVNARRAACQILKDIGTKDSLPALQACAQVKGLLQRDARLAIAAINARP